jgi:hypothetical protein
MYANPRRYYTDNNEKYQYKVVNLAKGVDLYLVVAATGFEPVAKGL